MRIINKKFILSVVSICCLSLSATFAQDYKYEIGGGLGTAFYMGDANKSTPFKNMNIAGEAIFRYNRSFRWAYKGNLVVGGVSGDTKNSGNKFPYDMNTSFSRTFVELGGQVEYNFFNYSDKYAFLGTKRFSPYILAGVGVTMGTGDKTFFGLNIPLGVGIKYKWKERINLGFEFSVRKLFGDDFDDTGSDGLSLDDPYKIKSSFIKNKDWYCLTMFTITWDFGLRTQDCINLD